MLYQNLREGQFPNFDGLPLGWVNAPDVSTQSIIMDILRHNSPVNNAVSSIQRKYGTQAEVPPVARSILDYVEPRVVTDSSGRVLKTASGNIRRGIVPRDNATADEFLGAVNNMFLEYPEARAMHLHNAPDLRMKDLAKEMELKANSRYRYLSTNPGGDTSENLLKVRAREGTPDTISGRISGDSVFEGGEMIKPQFGYSTSMMAKPYTVNTLLEDVDRRALFDKGGINEVYLPERVQKVGVNRVPYAYQRDTGSLDMMPVGTLTPGEFNPYADQGQNAGGRMNLPSERRLELESLNSGRLYADPTPMEARPRLWSTTKRPDEPLMTGREARLVRHSPLMEAVDNDPLGQHYFTSRKERRPLEIMDGVDTRGTFVEGGRYSAYPSIDTPTIRRNAHPEIDIFNEGTRGTVLGDDMYLVPEFSQSPWTKDVKVLDDIMLNQPGAKEEPLQPRNAPSSSLSRRMTASYDSLEPHNSTNRQYMANIGRGIGPDTASTDLIRDSMGDLLMEDVKNQRIVRGEIPRARNPEGRPTYMGTDSYSLGLGLAARIHEGLNRNDQAMANLSEARKDLNNQLMARLQDSLPKSIERAGENSLLSFLAFDEEGRFNETVKDRAIINRINQLENVESELRDREIVARRDLDAVRKYGFEDMTRVKEGDVYSNLDLDLEIQDQVVGRDANPTSAIHKQEPTKFEWSQEIGALKDAKEQVPRETERRVLSIRPIVKRDLTGLGYDSIGSARRAEYKQKIDPRRAWQEHQDNLLALAKERISMRK